MKKYLFIFFIAGCTSLFAQSGPIGFGTDTPDNSAVLHLDDKLYSEPKGFLVPRLTVAERNNISNPANGLLIYNNENNRFEYNAGTPGAPKWVSMMLDSLQNGKVYVGDVSNKPAQVSISGDASLSNTGNLTVTGLQTNAISSTAPTDGQVLMWDNLNSEWKPQDLSTSLGVSILKVTKTIDVPGINPNDNRSVDVTVTGAQVGSSVVISPSSALPTNVAIAYAYVSSAGTVTINFYNGYTAVRDPGSMDYYITVIK